MSDEEVIERVRKWFIGAVEDADRDERVESVADAPPFPDGWPRPRFILTSDRAGLKLGTSYQRSRVIRGRERALELLPAGLAREIVGDRIG